MLLAIAVFVVLFGLLAVITSSSRDARLARESQERQEKHAIAQIPPPHGFEDCPPDALAAVREGNNLRAIHLLFLINGRDLDKAKARVGELAAALKKGPALARPPSGLLT